MTSGSERPENPESLPGAAPHSESVSPTDKRSKQRSDKTGPRQPGAQKRRAPGEMSAGRSKRDAAVGAARESKPSRGKPVSGKPARNRPDGGKPAAVREPVVSTTWHVPDELANETLVGALRFWLPNESWGRLRMLLRRCHISVNGNLCLDEGRRLKPGEVVKQLANPIARPPQQDDVRVRHIDRDVVVVEKPGGMTTLRHPEERLWPKRRRQLQPTLDEILPRILDRRAKGQQRAPAGPGQRLRPVHRLDRETSGLLVFARHVEAERGLGHQFKIHSIHRVYLTVVPGRLTARTIESRLIPDRGDGRRGSSRFPDQGKEAITHIRPVEYLGDYTLLECRLETGRTHQIRIHLSELGHPVCGDKVYRGPFPGKPLVDNSGAPRLALHAAELGFIHPMTKGSIHFSMPLPPDLSDFVERLRRTRGAGTTRPTASESSWPAAVAERFAAQKAAAGAAATANMPGSLASPEAGDDEDDDFVLVGDEKPARPNRNRKMKRDGDASTGSVPAHVRGEKPHGRGADADFAGTERAGADPRREKRGDRRPDGQRPRGESPDRPAGGRPRRSGPAVPGRRENGPRGPRRPDGGLSTPDRREAGRRTGGKPQPGSRPGPRAGKSSGQRPGKGPGNRPGKGPGQGGKRPGKGRR